MNINNHRFFYCFLILISLTEGCIKPFDPPKLSNQGILVIDGHIYKEEGVCRVKLTRSQNLGEKTRSIPEKNAIVSLEDDQGNSYPVKSSIIITPMWLTASKYDTSNYETSGLVINDQSKYRLRIRTKDNKEYLSAWESVKKTPPIKNLVFERGDNADWYLKVNTHDPSNSTWYYRWEFTETWEYKSNANSQYDFGLNAFIMLREDNIYVCWKSANSKDILTTSSKKLGEDVVSNFKINTILENSGKLDEKYSILVKQYAISEDEFNYWQMLKINTETNGSIFDPQPSQVTGNFTCITDEKEPVLGYFSPYAVAKRRITREYNDFKPVFAKVAKQVCDYKLMQYFEVKDNWISVVVISIKRDDAGEILGYETADRSCADCRMPNFGGFNIKPAFMSDSTIVNE